jgi:hypothetical protein
MTSSVAAVPLRAAMTADEQLCRTIEDVTEDKAASMLQLLAQPRDLDGETATKMLNSIPALHIIVSTTRRSTYRS